MQALKNWINSLPSPWNIVAWIAQVLLLITLAWGATKLNKLVFARIQKKQKAIHLSFFEKVNSLLIVSVLVIVAVSSFSGFHNVWQTLLGGTAIVSAVVAFVAQDVIKDILAGLVISLSKPFEIGDRIVLENGTSGVVKNITMRHVVLRGVNTIYYIIPNSKINTLQISNFSYESEYRSIQFTFHVGYESDMAKVKRVIAEAVESSPYTSPGLLKKGKMCYAPVYFMAFEDSSLQVSVLVYYKREHATETVTDNINTSVREALRANGIEIPYNYVNVVNVN